MHPKVIARLAIINTYVQQGHARDSKFLKEIESGKHDEIFTVRAIEEALKLVAA